jgi:hypothetical protein
MRWWKIVGLASVVGVAATGIVIVRAERRRRACTPDEIRERLRIRHIEASAAVGGGSLPDTGLPDTGQSAARVFGEAGRHARSAE